jgi:hypothetical protein
MVCFLAKMDLNFSQKQGVKRIKKLKLLTTNISLFKVFKKSSNVI